MRIPLPFVAGVATAILLAACGGDKEPTTPIPTPPPPTAVASVTLAPDSSILDVGITKALVAVPRDAAGNPLTGRAVTWASSAPAIARVDTLGVVTAVSVGRAVITAMSSGKSAQSPVVVRGIPVASVSVATALDTLEAWDTLTLAAVVRDSGLNVLTDRVVRWTSSNPAVARIDSITGVLTGIDRGTVTVTATSEGKSGIASRVVVIKYRSLVAGTQHSCDIASGGIVWCWGQNGEQGRLGMAELGATVISSQPVRVPNTGPDGIRAKKLASFARHTCALDVNGKAWCWGGNGWGTLGVSAIAQSATPVAVSGGLTFKDIVVGAEHSCALTADGAMYCWGHNDWRQFAANAPSMAEAPVAVAPQLRFASLTAGSTFTCGVTTTNQGYCWGYSGWGNLGDGGAISYANTFSAAPVQITGGQAWSQLGGGQIHACGLTTTGQGYCWGNNGGKLGNGGTLESSTPVALQGAPTFTSLAVGANHSCAISAAANVWCWGFNGNGQLAQAASDVIDHAVQVPALTAAEVAASGIGTGSGSHTCAVTVDRLTVKCWGRNDTGQLGTGVTSAATVANALPATVVGQTPL